MKRINEIFSDYEAGDNINTAIVEEVVLRKGTKTLEMRISSDKYIEAGELECLNMFIRERFALEDSKITVEYASGMDKKPMGEELKNVVLALADKYPALKAVLNNSEIEVADNTVNFNFKVPVTDLLKSMDYDKKINMDLKNQCGTEYKINFIDKVSPEELIGQQEGIQASEMPFIPKEVKAIPSNNESKAPWEAAEKRQETKVETDGK
jgi:DNA polymerase-3 subunit alpha (Gram-positive type)